MSDKVHTINSVEELDALFASNTYVALDFTASWCGPCKTISPIFAQLANTHAVDGHFALAKVDVDAVQAAAQRYRISAMPTFMFFKEGKQVAVNGQPMIRGADPRALGAAVEKVGGLAKKRAAESS